MKRVTTVEMQSRLSELLARQDAELTQVTYQGTPIVAVLPLEHYQTLQASMLDHPEMAVETSRESISQAQLLFHSCQKRLLPRLQGQAYLVKIIEVTRRKKLAGALLAWNDWLRLVGSKLEEPLAHEDHRLQMTAARNHLLKLPEQFAREEQAGIFAPITVMKQGEPVMAIVSWQWFEYVTNALQALVMPEGTIRRVPIHASPEPSQHDLRECE